MFDPATLQRLYRYSFALTGDEANAYDLLHDGIERLLRFSGPVPSPVEPYLRRIIRNRFIDQYRQSCDRNEVSLDVIAEVGADADANELEAVVIAARDMEHIWAMLDPTDREIMYFWAVDGCSAKEIAKRMEIPRGTVLSRIHRLRRRLSLQFEKPTGAAAKG